MFTVPAARSHGLGARLLARAEALVAARGAGRLLVKTRDVPENRALGFYQRVGFARIATVESHGKRLALFAKPVAAAPAGPNAC